MSNPRPPDIPAILKRADPLSSSHGEPNKELAEYVNHSDRNGARGPPPSSFKRTFQGLVALGCSRSQSAQNTPTNEPPRRRGHSKSMSDVSTVKLISSDPLNSAPLKAKRFSALPRGPALSVVSEDFPSEHASSSSVTVAEPPTPVLNDVKTLQTLHRGTLLTKVSAKKNKVCLFRLEPDLGQIVWVSKKHKIIPIETIKEIRTGEDTRYTREHLQLAREYEDRWITIIYILDGTYKTLNLVAPDMETFQMWDRTLRDLYNIRKELMRGLGNGEMRQAIWEKQYWKAADEEPDHKLSFSEIESLCRKLNINSNREDLLRLFKQADTQKRNYLDFDDFRRFVKLLKARPEIDRLYKKLRSGNDGNFDFGVFERFMRDKQMSTLPREDLRALFDKYSTSTASLDHLGEVSTYIHAPRLPSVSSVMTFEGFTSFLLSPDNSAFVDQYRDVSQNMTRPLSEYFISSSHNTYLVGHQLVGSSTIEGYIRALLHGCRSVEVDIYDGEMEPMIFHGKTLTTKVSLREVCRAIMKYGFSTSPYPIIISAEVHCSIPQQDRIAAIMIEEFGDCLVRIPPEGMGKIEVLPSPEDLKGKILLKAKNQNFAKTDSIQPDPFMSEMSSSASDSDVFEIVRHHIPISPVELVAATRSEPAMIGIGPISKATTSILQRVKSVGSKSAKDRIVDRKSAPPTNDGILSQSPPSMNTSEEARAPSLQSASPTTSATPTPGILQRARKSFRGSSSSTSDVTSSKSLSDTSTSSADTSLSPPSSKPLTFLQRLRTNKSSSKPTKLPPIVVPTTFPAVPPLIPSGKRYTAPTLETVLAKSTSPSTATSTTFATPPHSATFKAGPIASRRLSDVESRSKLKMSPHLLALLVYTVGVKCRGINKKEEYAPEHMFSLSEKMANKMLKFGMWDLIKHTKTHMVRTYPKGTRVSSTNYEPHRFWASGTQLVALNWQTFDLGYMINYAMFQRNGRSGYVLKPDAIRLAQKDMLSKRLSYTLSINVISGQQLPRPKDTSGHEIGDKTIVDPYVEVTLYVPDWPVVHDSKKDKDKAHEHHLDDGHPTTAPSLTSTPSYSVSMRTSTVKKNGFNPVWEEELTLPFDCVGDMMDLIFVRFMVKQELKDSDEPLAVYCVPLGSLQQGYRHLPLHDSQMSQYLFSTLFVRINVNLVSTPST